MTSWYNGQPLTKQIDKLLITHPTLEKLLDYPDFIAQLKSFNSHLLQYLSQTPDLIRQAIEYIMIAPNQSDTQQRKYKYPLLSTEMFETESICLATNFFKDSIGIPGCKNYLDYFYQQLDQSHLLELCAGYFYRINLVLLNMKFKQFVDHLYSRPLIFKKLLNHSYNSSITNTLQVILNLDNTKIDKTTEEIKNIKVDTMRNIFSKIKFDNQGDALSNLSSVIIQVIEKYYLIVDGKSLLDIIVERQNIELIFELGQSSNPFINIPMLNVLLSIINYYSFSSFNSEEKGNPDINRKNMQKFDKQPLIQILAYKFEKLIYMLTSTSKLTTHHFKILQVLCHSISLSSMTLLFTIKRTKFFESLLDLLFKHEQCNIAHTLIQRAFLHIFVSDKAFYQEHKLYLFCEMNIIKKTVLNIVGQKFEVLKNKHFFGHLMRIIKIYSNIQTTNENIILSIRQNSQLWGKVAKDIIKPYQQICSKQLGSYNIPFAPTVEYKVRLGLEIKNSHSPSVNNSQFHEDYSAVAKIDNNKFKPQTSFDGDEEQFRSSLGKDSNIKTLLTQAFQNANNSASNSSQKKSVSQILSQQKTRQAAQASNNLNKSSSQSNISTQKDSGSYQGSCNNSRSLTPDPKQIARLRVRKLDIIPSQKMFRKVDERDATLMILLGIQL